MRNFLRLATKFLLPILLVFVVGIVFQENRPVYSQTRLPDLTPSSFSICYRPNSQNLNTTEFSIIIGDKNAGSAKAASHGDRVFITDTVGCSVHGAGYHNKIEDFQIPGPLAVGATYFTTRKNSRSSIPLICAQTGYVGAYFGVNEPLAGYGNVEENNYRNNGAQIFPVQRCR